MDVCVFHYRLLNVFHFSRLLLILLFCYLIFFRLSARWLLFYYFFRFIFPLLFRSCRNYYFILFIPFIINLKFDIGFCLDEFDSLFCLCVSFTISLPILSLICALIRFQSLNQWVCFISFTFRGIKVNYLITLPFRTNFICYK